MQDVSQGEHDGSIFERLLLAYSVSSPPELAAAMREPLATVKGWKQRASVPLDRCVQAWRDTKCSLDWLVLGLPVGRFASAGAAEAYASSPTTTFAVAETAAPWLVPVPVSPDRSPANGRSQGPGTRALLPAEGGSTGVIRPLVLTLAVQAEKLDYYVIPRIVGGASAGTGAFTTADVTWDQAGDFALSADWLQSHLAHTSGELASVKVIGDSMTPTLVDGDTILVDKGVRVVEADGIYVLNVYGRVLVKRVQRKMDGSLVLISDNETYERETISRDRARDVIVIGRMVWPRVR